MEGTDKKLYAVRPPTAPNLTYLNTQSHINRQKGANNALIRPVLSNSDMLRLLSAVTAKNRTFSSLPSVRIYGFLAIHPLSLRACSKRCPISTTMILERNFYKDPSYVGTGDEGLSRISLTQSTCTNILKCPCRLCKMLCAWKAGKSYGFHRGLTQNARVVNMCICV